MTDILDNNSPNITRTFTPEPIQYDIRAIGLFVFPVLGAAMFAVGGVIYGAVIAAPVIAAGCATKLALKATNREGLNTLACGLLTLGVATGAGVGTYSLQREYTPGINEIQHTAVENINNWAQERMAQNAE